MNRLAWILACVCPLLLGLGASQARRPAPTPAEKDPCAAVRCASGTTCTVVHGLAQCLADKAAETPAQDGGGVSGCAAMRCAPGARCTLVKGMARCVPRRAIPRKPGPRPVPVPPRDSFEP